VLVIEITRVTGVPVVVAGEASLDHVAQM